MHKIRAQLWIGIACLGLASLAAAQGPAPLVVAVDISRSLDASELAITSNKLAAFVTALPAETPAGLLVFADQPRWIAKPGVLTTEIVGALRGLRPEGRFTLLHDALFVASQELATGGVVVLVTDGRDENSASTLDDITRIFAERGIRIVALAAGPDPATRSLRRLALLSNGSFAGHVRDLALPALLATSTQALAEVATPGTPTTSLPGPAPAQPAEPAEPAAATVAAPATQPSATSGAKSGSPIWFWPAVLGLAIAAGVITWLLLRRRAVRAEECPRCGSELPPGAHGECAACQENGLLERLRHRPVAGPDFAIDAFLDTAVVPQLNLEERLERTAVMVDQPALVVREPGEPPRSFGLPDDKAFSVGREPGRNTLAVPSVTLSAEHFRVVPDEGKYCLLDLQSTNGTFLNGQRVRAARLEAGDVLRAGQVEFEFTVQQQFAPRAKKSAASR
jgi:FHA domain/von Willebrand factor type A domain